MKKTAIICEYNPFTNGHAHHITRAKEETGADCVICVMSGSFTQRGEAAVLDRYKRAEIAVRCGADLVVELPLLYAISPADNFAYGAMKTIAAIGDVEYVSFGSECGDVDALVRAADFTENEPVVFKTVLRKYLDEGNSYPKAYALAVSEYARTDENYAFLDGIFDQPNNCLGVCYVKAAKKIGLSVKFHTIRREANDNEEELIGEYPSASSVRKALRLEKYDEIRSIVPKICYENLINVKTDGTALKDLCLFKIRSVNGYDLMRCYDMDVAGGLYNRMKLAADEAATFDEFLQTVKSKNYTMARIKRICLCALFDITKDMYEQALCAPAYVYVLAINKNKKSLLSEIKSNCPNVLIRYSDVSKVDKSVRTLVKLDFQAHGTLALVNRIRNLQNTAIFVEI